MLAQHHRARVTVRVPRGTAGGVESGVRSVLEAVDGVATVEVHDLEGVRPGALDLRVDARVTVAFAAPTDAPEAHLEDGFGVLAVAVD